jgi:outer membrane protein insertion porin family
MFKFLFIIFFCSLISLNSNAEIIESVEVNGNKRITKETIILLGSIDFNKSYDENTVNQLLKDLFATGFFDEIEINIIEKKLIINISENSIIDSIDITGVKNNSLKNLIIENIELKNRSSFNDNKLQKDINTIDNILKRNGYYFSTIKSNILKDENLNSIKLNFDIQLGKKAKLKKISFIGNKNIKDKKLLEVIASEEHKFWKFLSNKVYLNESVINVDKRLLENYYKNLGYYNVKIVSSFVEFDKEGDFILVFNIDSGNKYFFDTLSLDIPPDYNRKDFSKLEETLISLKGKIYSINNLNSILKDIEKISSEKMYEFIDIQIEEKIIDNRINLSFKVNESENFYIEKINIFGNYQTIEEVIRNKLIVDEGDPLNKLLYNKSLDNIRSLRIFKEVKGTVNDGSDASQKIIDITVEEQPTGEISLTAGVGTTGTSIGAGIVEKNFLGKGINLNTDFLISDESLKGQFIYKKPNFAYTDNTLSTSFKALTTDLLSSSGYKTSTISSSIGTEFEQYENLSFNPELLLSFENLETNNTASSQLRKQEGNYEDLYFNYGLNYDLRNSQFNATEGSQYYFNQELPILSEGSELSNTFILTNYKTLNQNTGMIGKTSFYFKAINSMNNSDVRLSKRLYAPYNRLRGFEKGKIGPKDNEDYIGGNYVSTLNFSTNLPGLFPTVENIDFSYFIDMANVWGVDYNDTLDSSNKIRSSTGIGIDFLTPIGPLSFSFSNPITKSASDKTESFRFNLGTTF